MRYVRIVGNRPSLLQHFRLVHALAEAGVPIAVAKDEVARFCWLDQYFDNLRWRVARRYDRRFSDVEIEHATPSTRIGSITRPLVFAHGVADRCGSMWANRSQLISFDGLVTDRRASVLAPLRELLGQEFRLVASSAGRDWPGKAWDETYFRTLGSSRFVACPDGDYVWTYRFFEACLCGAIPVIESTCSLYQGFHFFRLSDPPSTWQWSGQLAEHNALLARQRLTVPHAELREQMGVPS